MRTNPFLDALSFLTGQTPGHQSLGFGGYVFAAFTIALVIGGLVVAVRTWQSDPAQQSANHIAIFLARALIGAMWLEGSLWKLPLPAGGGLPYWLGLMGDNAAFAAYGGLIKSVLIPNVMILSFFIWLTETTLAVSLILGLAVRLTSLLGIAMSLNLWLGLYHYQPEWPWIYVFIAILHVFFIVTHAGRSLGLDTLARARIDALLAGRGKMREIYVWST